MLSFVRVPGAPYRDWWNERYAPDPKVLSTVGFWQRGVKSVWIAARDLDPGELAPVEGVGIPFLRIRSVWKPTSIGIVHFGATATRNVVDLVASEVVAFLRRERLEWDPDHARATAPHRGFVIVRFAGVPLGCGIWRGTALDPAIPKGRRVEAIDLPVRPSGH